MVSKAEVAKRDCQDEYQLNSHAANVELIARLTQTLRDLVETMAKGSDGVSGDWEAREAAEEVQAALRKAGIK